MVQNNSEQTSMATKVNDPSTDDLKQINDLMSDGKKYLICDQPQKALEYFVELCEKLAYHYGQQGKECLEAYLYYGKTLLEIARMENGVLGHAIKEAPILGEDEEGNTTEEDEEAKNERQEIRENVNNAMRDGNLFREKNSFNEVSTEESSNVDDVNENIENKDTTQSKDTNTEEEIAACSSSENITTDTEQPTTSSTEESSDTAVVATSKESDEATNNEQENTTKDTHPNTTDVPMEEQQKVESENQPHEADQQEEQMNGTGDEAVAEEEEDVTNLQLAWEMFELTVVICTEQIKLGVNQAAELRQIKEKMAEAKYGLGQVSLESERFAEAIPDFKECVALFEEILDKNDRRIAEVYYNIGLALASDNNFDGAIQNYEKAVAIMKERIDSLKQKVEVAKETAGKEKISSEAEEWEKEITELNDIVMSDMMGKIEDAQDMQKQMNTTKEALKEAAKEIFSGIGTSNAFDQGFDEGFDTSEQCTQSTEAVHDITSKVRSAKRKPTEDETPTVDAKKLKSNEKTNGDILSNGHINGDTNGHTDPEEREAPTEV